MTTSELSRIVTRMENTANAIRSFLASTDYAYCRVMTSRHWDGSQFVLILDTPWLDDKRTELLEMLRDNFCGAAFIDRVNNIMAVSATPA